MGAILWKRMDDETKLDIQRQVENINLNTREKVQTVVEDTIKEVLYQE